MDAGIEVKVEDYDGTYACVFCSESVRGTAALKCSQCSSNPVHAACVAGSTYAWQCMTCRGETMRVWRGGSDETAAPSEVIDLTPDQEVEEGVAEELPTLAEHGAREDAVPAVGGGVVAADVVARRMREGRADAGGGSSGKGKEPAMDVAGLEAGGDGAATSARAGAGGGGGKGKERADGGSARAGIGGKNSGGGGEKGSRSGHLGGSGGSRAADDPSGQGSSKRAAPDGDERGSSRAGKRARGERPGQCEHARQRSQCKECGGGSICQHNRIRHRCRDCGGEGICQHNRIRSSCKECGGGGICQHNRIRSQCRDCGGGSICEHNRIRSRCKTCKAEKDDSMPPGLEEL